MALPKMLTVKQVSELTGIPENTLRFWKHIGSGPPCQRIGRRVYYLEEELNTWFEEQFAKGSQK